MTEAPSLNAICSDRQWRKGVKVQFRVIGALVIRDVLSRFGHSNLGLFWIFAEPIILMCGVSVLWSIVHASHDENVSIVPFALSGYSFLTIWRHVVSRSIGSLRSNISLRYHRTVRLLDVIIARTLAEAFSVFSAFVIIYIPLALLGICPLIRDPLDLIIGYLFISWFSFAVGLILGSFSEFGHSMHHVIPPLMYISLPLTGVFTMQSWLPERVRVVLSWSPLVNAIEMIRSGIFPSEVRTYYSISYLVVCCALTTVVGLHLFRVSETMVESE